MTREDWKRYEKIANTPDVRLAMECRCEEQGHEFEQCCSAAFQLYQKCKWCGKIR